MPPRPLITRLAILLIVSTVLGLLTWLVVHHARFNANPLGLLPDNVPEVAGLKIYQQNFANQHDMIVVLRPEDPADGIVAARSLATALKALQPDAISRISWRQPFIADAEPVALDPLDTSEAPGQMGTEPSPDDAPLPDAIDDAPAEELNPDAGEMLGFVWMNLPPQEFGKLVERLEDGNSSALFDKNMAALENAVTTEDMAAAGYGYDPLGLLKLPGIAAVNFENGNSNRIQFTTEDEAIRVVLIEAAGSDLYNYEESLAWTELVKTVVIDWHNASPFKDSVGLEVTGRAPYIAEVSKAMRDEMVSSIFVTVTVILSLFWLMYRRILPLVYLMTALFVIFLVTIGIGGLIYDELSAMSVGFAAILIGLVVDYGFVIFQESLDGETKCPHALRKRLVRTIGWASLTTVVVFLGLNRSSLPGAAQLGTMVAVGIGTGAITMLFLFTWCVVRFCRRPPKSAPAVVDSSIKGDPWPGRLGTVFVTTLLIASSLAILVIGGLPVVSRSSEAVRPKSSKVWNTYKEVMAKLSRRGDSIMVIAAGPDYGTVLDKLRWIERECEEMRGEGMAIEDWTLPTALWPDQANLEANRESARKLAAMKGRLNAEAANAFFDPSSMRFTNTTLDAWARFADRGAEAFPDNDVSSWVTDKIFDLKEPELAAAGSVEIRDGTSDEDVDAIIARLTATATNDAPQIYLASWDHLNPAIGRLMVHDLYSTILPISAMVVLMLLLVFRDFRGPLLSLATLAVSGLLHLAFMTASGTQWNIINIVAIPLLLGAGLDYSIHMQIALRKSGNAKFSQQALGRALLLCGISTAVGFGSLAFSSNKGLATLGLVCAVGILSTMIVSVVLLPGWFALLDRKKK